MSIKPLCIAFLLLIPAVASATSKDFSARSWLGLVPPMPVDSAQAYAQWDHGCEVDTPTPLKQLSEAVKAHAQDTYAAVTQSPSVQAEQRLAQQYGNPEAAARIRAMSPAEQMALAQKMQRQMSAGTVPAGPMSRNDIRVMELIQKHSEAEARATGEIAAFNTNDWLPMSRKWESDASALKTGPVHFTVDKMSRDEMSKELQARLALDKKRVHLADANLGKAKSLLTKINVIVGPELDAADTAHEAWTQMRNAQLKQKMAGQERAAMMAAIGNVQTIAGLVRDASERAAKAMAAYKTDENMLRGGNTDLCQSM